MLPLWWKLPRDLINKILVEFLQDSVIDKHTLRRNDEWHCRHLLKNMTPVSDVLGFVRMQRYNHAKLYAYNNYPIFAHRNQGTLEGFYCTWCPGAPRFNAKTLHGHLISAHDVRGLPSGPNEWEYMNNMSIYCVFERHFRPSVGFTPVHMVHTGSNLNPIVL